MHKKTPLRAIIIAGIVSIILALLFEVPERPFTTGQAILLYLIALLPSMGIAMLFDPAPARAREEFLKINFYEER
jgi:amino acid transporter